MDGPDPAAHTLNALASQFAAIGRLIEAHPDLTGIRINADGIVRTVIAGKSAATKYRYTAGERMTAIRMMAGLQGVLVGPDNPTLDTRLDLFTNKMELDGHKVLFGGLRVHADLPPIAREPALVFRVPARVIYTLDDFVKQGSITPEQCVLIKEAVRDKKNIVVAGGTGSGKTTFLKAIIWEIEHDRLVVVEDNPELFCRAEDHLFLETRPSHTMEIAMFHNMRRDPDRIVLGEIRSGEVAKSFCNMANTGHPGSMATIHASSAAEVFSRFKSLISEVVVNIDETSIRNALDICIYVAKVTEHTSNGPVFRRKVTELITRESL